MNQIHENLLSVIKGKKVLFLENDGGLYQDLDVFEKWLINHKIKYKCLFNVVDVPFKKIVSAINKAPTKPIREWLNELPEPWRTQAIGNSSLTSLGRSETSLQFAVLTAFSWIDSSEGFSYWFNFSETL